MLCEPENVHAVSVYIPVHSIFLTMGTVKGDSFKLVLLLKGQGVTGIHTQVLKFKN